MTFLVAAYRKMIMVNGEMLIIKRTREKIGNLKNSLILKWKVFMPKILSLVRIEANFLDYFLMNLRMQ